MNQNRNDHYVYVLKDKFGVIRYIGEGRKDRLNSKDRRQQEYFDVLADSGKLEKLHDCLTKEQAKSIENGYLDKYLGKITNGWNLINKAGSRKQRKILYAEVIEHFGIDFSNPLILVSKYTTSNKSREAGKHIGTLDRKSGYYKVMFNGVQCKSHRLLWVLYNKSDLDPFMVVNHINGVKDDNRPENLEAVTSAENSFKTDKKKLSSISNERGISVSFDKTGLEIYRSAFTDIFTDERKAASFSVSKYGREDALFLARLFRAICEAQYVSKSAMLEAEEKFKIEFNKRNPDNIYGYSGISLIGNHGKASQLFSVWFRGESKKFSINKYGYDEALRLAVNFRKQLEENYN